MHICIRIGASRNKLIQIHTKLFENQFPPNITRLQYEGSQKVLAEFMLCMFTSLQIIGWVSLGIIYIYVNIDHVDLFGSSDTVLFAPFYSDCRQDTNPMGYSESRNGFSLIIGHM